MKINLLLLAILISLKLHGQDTVRGLGLENFINLNNQLVESVIVTEEKENLSNSIHIKATYYKDGKIKSYETTSQSKKYFHYPFGTTTITISKNLDKRQETIFLWKDVRINLFNIAGIDSSTNIFEEAKEYYNSVMDTAKLGEEVALHELSIFIGSQKFIKVDVLKSYLHGENIKQQRRFSQEGKLIESIEWEYHPTKTIKTYYKGSEKIRTVHLNRSGKIIYAEDFGGVFLGSTYEVSYHSNTKIQRFSLYKNGILEYFTEYIFDPNSNLILTMREVNHASGQDKEYWCDYTFFQ